MARKIPDRLKQALFRYIKVRAKDKRPMELSWQDKNNYEFFDEAIQQHLANGGNIGIATGFGNLVVVDFDNKTVQEKVAHKLPPTFTVESGGGLVHKYYYCNKPGSWKILDKKNETIIDVQGKGKQIICPPSIHPNGKPYKVIQDIAINNITLAELKAFFSEYIKSEDLPKTITQQPTLKKLIKPDLLPVLQKHGVDVSTHPTTCPWHSSKGGRCFSFNEKKQLWRCFHCEKKGDVINFVQIEKNCDFKTACKELGIEIPLFKKFSSSQKKEEDDAIYTSFVDADETICEQTINPNRIVGSYTTYNLQSGQIKIVNNFVYNNIEYKPINAEEIRKGVVKLPTGVEEYGTEEELLAEIQTFIHKYVQLDEEFEMFSAWYVLLTWVYEKFDTVNYMRMLGDIGTGKSRYEDVMVALCYKSITLTGAGSVASIFRLIDKYKGTPVIDEADWKGSDEYNEIVKIMNCGFEKGKPVTRADKNDNQTIHCYDTFCPKVLSSRRVYDDDALESRCITAETISLTRPEIPLNLMFSDFDTEKEILRNKLLMYRFKNLKTKPKQLTVADLPDIEPRLIQMTMAFASLFVGNEKMFNKYKKYMVKKNDSLKELRANSIEGMIVNTIYEMEQDGKIEITAQGVLDEMIQNKTVGVNTKMSSRSIGKRLRNLNIQTKLDRTKRKVARIIQTKGIEWNRNVERFVITNENKSVTNVTFVTTGRDSPAALRVPYSNIYNKEMTEKRYVLLQTLQSLPKATQNGKTLQTLQTFPVVEKVEDISNNSSKKVENEVSQSKDTPYPLGEDIHQKCHVCGDSPSIGWSKTGNPLCGTCKQYDDKK